MMEIEHPANKTELEKLLDQLLEKEKVARQDNNLPVSCKIVTEIIQLAYDAKEYETLFNMIKLLAKKRGQHKKAQIEMIQLAMKFVDNINDLPTKLKLVNTIKEVCEKKIYLEVEYARCCLMLVKHQENENNINEAAKILQEVQVETYGSMDKREKLEFLLYQMKIMIKKLDMVRLFLVGKKINKKNLNENGLEDLKILFYSYMIYYYLRESKYFEIADCYYNIFETLHSKPQLKDKLPIKIDFNFKSDYQTVFENYILFLIISTHSPEQVTKLNELLNNYESKLEESPKLAELVQCILSKEIISTDIKYYGVINLEPFSEMQNQEIHITQFRKQLVQHNVRVVHAYYKQIHLKRMAELFACGEEEVEKELCEMINLKLIKGKIDRIDGIVVFPEKRHENLVLNDWEYDLHSALELIDKTCHLINREKEIYLK